MQLSTQTSSARTRRRFITLAVAAAVLPASVLSIPTGASSAAADGEVGTVQRVVDGDTLVIVIDGRTETVRLLNIDTPETKDPRQPVECLGPAASAFTSRLVRPGTQVSLAYDDEERDGYGRLLAAVTLPNGRSLSEQIAAAGLGVPIVIGGNDRFESGVRKAFATARDRKIGFFDARNDCTVPAQYAALQNQLTSASQPTPPTSAAQAHGAAKRLAYALALLYVLDVRLNSANASLRWVAARTDARLRRTIKQNMRAGRRGLTTLSRVDARMGTEERRYQARLAREAREAEYRRLYPPAPSYNYDDDESGGSGGSDGYNGPRCYEPGGKVWHPC